MWTILMPVNLKKAMGIFGFTVESLEPKISYLVFTRRWIYWNDAVSKNDRNKTYESCLQ